MTKTEVLSKYFGYASFRGGQEEIIDNILNGRDVIAVMPTGAGKSLCFQIPALMKEGTALVISPLISLMKDQIAALKENGIAAETMNSSTDSVESHEIYRYVCAGAYKLLYVSPEKLDTPGFVKLASRMNISMVCIDEAHCVSQWVQDFRSSYLKIPHFIASLPKRPVVSAFTATATQLVREDIVRLLELREPEITVTGFDRPNLYFEVQKPKSKLNAVRKYLDSHIDNCGIIYCSTRKGVDELYSVLTAEGYNVSKYHAGLDAEERRLSQESFVMDRVKVMIATNAFGMGIDKSDVSFVIHYNMPGDIESYYQEAGRAGRDGENAECILLYGGRDVSIQKYFINNPSDNEEMSDEEISRLKQRRFRMLNHMIAYSSGEVCLRKYILKYFGERTVENCGNCSVCCGERKYSDITVSAQKVLSAVARTKEKLSLDMIVDFLKGNERIGELDPGLLKIKTFGIMDNLSRKKIREIIAHLLRENVVETAAAQGGSILKLNENSRAVLFDNKRVRISIAETGKTADKKKKNEAVPAAPFDEALFNLLKNLRKTVADKKAVPAFVVFSDATLREMCRVKPTNNEEFLEVSGVGIKKLEEYGPVFLKAINLYEQKINR